MIIVTGGAGFIGSNILSGLNQRGRTDLWVVDNQRKQATANLAFVKYSKFLDMDEFLKDIKADKKFSPKVEAIFHQGACSDTTVQDRDFMLQTNFYYSKFLLEYCLRHQIRFIYASSGAIYGTAKDFREHAKNEKALNIYGSSKQQFDDLVREILPTAKTQIVGLRYFNVYGSGEQDKGKMASVIFHFNQQLLKSGKLRLFEASHGYGSGEQRRDFVYIDDVVKVNLWFLDHSDKSGIFNVGTGRSRSFNDVAQLVLQWHGGGQVEYIAFPEELKTQYQSFTQADLQALHKIGYQEPFTSLEAGVGKYLERLNSREDLK